MSRSKKVLVGLAYIVGGFALALVGNIIAVDLFLGNKGLESIAYIPAMVVLGMGVFRVVTGLFGRNSPEQ